MPQSGQPAVLVANFAMTPATPFDRHVHAQHQLAWAMRGVLTVSTDTAEWVLPATRALWIPARVPHEIGCRGGVRGASQFRLLTSRPCGRSGA